MAKKSTKETQKLITKGKKKGHLTYEEINEILPDDIITPEDIDDLLITLDDLNIEVVSSPEEYYKKKQVTTPRIHPQVEKAKFKDPTRAYLSQMGRIPLLSREEEIRLAKEIEEGNKNIKKILKELMKEDIFLLVTKKRNFVDLVQRTKTALQTGERGLAIEGYTEREWQFDKEKLRRFLPELTREAERVIKAKEKMIKSNLRLVVSIAKKYINRGLPLLDFIQEGNMGLMRAVDKFEYKRGYKFSTYATWWIRQAITRAIADQARIIRIPVHMIETINKLSRITQKFVQKYGREPAAKELAKRMKLPVEKIRVIMKISHHPISLGTPVGLNEDAYLGDFIEDKEVIMPDTMATFSMLKEEISRVLDTLPERERGILKLRFGIGEGTHPHTLEEVGKKFNITRERVRQIEAKALSKLRQSNKNTILKGHIE